MATSGSIQATNSPSAPPATPIGSQGDQQVYEVDGHDLFLDCTGTVSPTVVFIHGLGGQASDWEQTVALLHDQRACIYDRVNAGRSSRDGSRHTATDSVHELHELLTVAGVDGPYLLVGHSLGGMLALMFAATHPDDVVGLILADASLPFEAELFPADIRDDAQRDMRQNPEHLDFFEAFGEAAALVPSVPDVPITYMSATRDVDLPAEWEAGAYVAGLEALIGGFPQGRITHEDSTHHMPREIPDRIAAEVRRMLDEAS